MRPIFTLLLLVLSWVCCPNVEAQVNEINSVVFGRQIPRFMADPRNGMPVRVTAADFSSFVPLIVPTRAPLLQVQRLALRPFKVTIWLLSGLKIRDVSSP